MVRPASFGYNPETAGNNFFQQPHSLGKTDLQQRALREFDGMVELLQQEGFRVIVVGDTALPPKPDALFPNNWISSSPDGKLFVYPMYAPNRRTEKREDILHWLASCFVISECQDWSEHEAEGRFLEGTGSMVIDHRNRLIYAALSERTHPSLVERYAAANGYRALLFLATDTEGRPVYHTNVVLSLGEHFAVLCEESVGEEWELIALRQLLESTGHRIVPITREQMHLFAGNMLELYNDKGESILVMSQTARDALRKDQVQTLETFSRLLPVSIPCIESAGGGSVRCMMAEIFLSPKDER